MTTAKVVDSTIWRGPPVGRLSAMAREKEKERERKRERRAAHPRSASDRRLAPAPEAEVGALRQDHDHGVSSTSPRPSSADLNRIVGAFSQLVAPISTGNTAAKSKAFQWIFLLAIPGAGSDESPTAES
jgi:hypothetical protein